MDYNIPVHGDYFTQSGVKSCDFTFVLIITYQEISVTISAVIDSFTADKLNTAREVFYLLLIFSCSVRLWMTL